MEMDLRLILLIVGGLVVGSIILDGMRRRRKAQTQETIENFEQIVLDKKNESLPDPLLDFEYGSSHYARINDAPEKVITLTLISKQERGFSGDALLSALQTAQMFYGDKEIFHYYIKENRTESIAFSLASMTEPGIFNLEQMNKTFFSGLMIFMVLPGPDDLLNSFEKMLSTAKLLATTLGGDLCDAKRSNLTIQMIEQYREQVRDFMRSRFRKQK